MTSIEATHEMTVLRYHLEATIWWAVVVVLWSMMGLATVILLASRLTR